MHPTKMVFGADGLWTGRSYACPPDVLAENLRPGETAVDAVEYPHAKRLVDGVLVDYRPPAPDDDHEWHEAARAWRLKGSVAAAREATATALARVRELEGRQARAVREAALNLPAAVARLQAIDDEIAALRSQLQP